MVKDLLNGKMLEFSDGENVAFVWWNDKTRCFVFEFNAKVVKATKTFLPIKRLIKKKKLDLV